MDAWRRKIMFAWVAFLNGLLPYGAGNRLAARTIRHLHPALSKQQARWLSGLSRAVRDPQAQASAWRDFGKLFGVARLHAGLYAWNDRAWGERCELTISGFENIEQARALGRGALVMTFHHHLNMMFCTLLAGQGVPLNAVAFDNRQAARYQQVRARTDSIYLNAEQMLHGGELILVKPQGNARAILRAFQKNQLVSSSFDFPDFFQDKNRLEYPFLDASLSCPTGVVKMAITKQVPILSGYLDWRGGNRFAMVLRPISDGVSDTTVDDAMTQYLAHLEDMVGHKPGLWEGWKWVDPKS